MKNNYDIIIIGAGPAGIFTALEVTKLNSKLNVLIVDKGRNIEDRKCPARKTGKCINCNPCGITYGWSGAGAFSDGKLSLSPEVGGRLLEYFSEDKSRELIKYCDDIYLDFGANKEVHGLNNERVDEIKYEASKYNIKLVECPVRHLGTELAYEVLKKMYYHLMDNTNTEFEELTEASDIIVEDNKIVGVKLKNKKEEKVVKAKYIIAAPGRGGAEWLSKESKKLNLKVTNNAVDIGVRVEVPNSIMDHLTKDLYEAKLVYYSDTFDNKVRTFCMNPGGVVSEEHYDDGKIAVVNGHSYSETELRTENTNFAVLVSTTFTEPFDQPIEYGKYIAKLGNMLADNEIMVQRLGDLVRGRRTNASRIKKSTTTPTLKSAVPGDLSFVLPQRHLVSIVEALKAFDNIAPGLYSKNTLLYGVEVKFYSSKFDTNDNFETPIQNFYTIGDGAGITRGLMQASATGVVVARDIVSKE
ncbi:NAD(P)/FAD-dependent oxidoreductase [Haloimpatiens sp. FM7330]|uniref:NAD(P)/FAD-dependent oxidoreductase n=1 Tax=Haloimpatiens sp. FM7330 TaxID=3298610 RepID=UPI0036262E68